jgi:hypothetical protein
MAIAITKAAALCAATFSSNYQSNEPQESF